MTDPCELFFKLVEQLQYCKRKIEPVLDGVGRAAVLLDRLEQAGKTESKLGQMRMVVDAVDDCLKGQTGGTKPSRPDISQLTRALESLSPEESDQLMEWLARRKSGS